MAQEGSFRSARAGARADPDGRPADLTDGASRMDGAPREPPLSTEGVAVEGPASTAVLPAQVRVEPRSGQSISPVLRAPEVHT